MKPNRKIDPRLERALRHPELGDRERVLLGAYLHFEALHGARCGHPGVCWPTDAEVGAYLGKSEVTIRRARRSLSEPRIGAPSHIAVRYVGPFGKLPDGTTSLHGSNVVTLQAVGAAGAGDAGPIELRDARTHVKTLEASIESAQRQLAAARARVEHLARAQALGAVIAQSPANEDGGPTSHNAPSVITLEWSQESTQIPERGGALPRKAAGW
jgi:hypothetical protein